MSHLFGVVPWWLSSSRERGSNKLILVRFLCFTKGYPLSTVLVTPNKWDTATCTNTKHATHTGGAMSHTLPPRAASLRTALLNLEYYKWPPPPLPKDSSPFEIDALSIDRNLFVLCFILAILKLSLLRDKLLWGRFRGTNVREGGTPLSFSIYLGQWIRKPRIRNWRSRKPKFLLKAWLTLKRLKG